jgi:hypothetical protein
MKAILGNPAMIKAYRDGIPANGHRVPDGAAFAKIEWLKARDSNSPYAVTVPGAQTEVSFMLKDSKRFPDTNGWDGWDTPHFSTTRRPTRSSGPQTMPHSHEVAMGATPLAPRRATSSSLTTRSDEGYVSLADCRLRASPRACMHRSRQFGNWRRMS